MSRTSASQHLHGAGKFSVMKVIFRLPECNMPLVNPTSRNFYLMDIFRIQQLNEGKPYNHTILMLG